MHITHDGKYIPNFSRTGTRDHPICNSNMIVTKFIIKGLSISLIDEYHNDLALRYNKLNSRNTLTLKEQERILNSNEVKKLLTI